MAKQTTQATLPIEQKCDYCSGAHSMDQCPDWRATDAAGNVVVPREAKPEEWIVAPPPMELPGWTMSANVAQLFAAVSLMQGALEGAKKGNLNPHFKSRYADLASVVGADREALAANGLAIIQMPRLEGDKLYLTTLLTHKSGQWIASTLGCNPGSLAPQPIGSGITYLRRQSRAAMVGVAPEDDDGEKAMGRRAEPETYKLNPEATVEKIKELVLKKGSVISDILAYYECEVLEDMSEAQRTDCVAYLAKKLDAR